MKIKKQNPSWFIIGDNKINVQTFQRYTDSYIGSDFEANWIKSNGKSTQVSQSEKLLEALGSDFLGLKNTSNLPVNEFISKNFKKFENLFNHFTITIVFDEVSHLFVQCLLMAQESLKINQKRLLDLSLWLPPIFENNALQNVYGELVGGTFTSIEQFIEAAKKNGVTEADALKTAFTMQPLAQHSRIVVTANISTWRDILIKLSSFDTDDETRFIILHLCRDLKTRYLSFFSDMVFESKEGKIFGVDSISNEGFWKNIKVKKQN